MLLLMHAAPVCKRGVSCSCLHLLRIMPCCLFVVPHHGLIQIQPARHLRH